VQGTWSSCNISLLKIKLLLLCCCWNSGLRLEGLDEESFDWCIEQTLFFGEDSDF
jgi:adenosylhomocysteinase